MSSDIVIAARGLTKSYRLFAHPGDRVKQFLSLGLKHYHRSFEALKDASFDLKRGETVGIIGRNGSGKSTLLQLVCGILKPTAGTVHVKGRISALLELGAGFNPEFTGRENVYFQGAVMGLPRALIDERFDDIAGFAEIGEFIDQPVRIYSSGMFLRLAFAVAVHTDPDILVVDEALAVGDAGFRARCFRRIGELQCAGCAILFVSHAMDQIVRHCGRCLLLDDGDLLADGAPETVVAQYRRLLGAAPPERAALRERLKHSPTAADACNPAAEWPEIEADDMPLAYAPNGALIVEVGLLDAAGEKIGRMHAGSRCRCLFLVRFTRPAAQVRFAMLLKSADGQDLGGAYTADSPETAHAGFAAGSAVEVEFSFACPLNPGTYRINVAAFAREGGMEYALHGIQGALRFRVESETDGCTIGPVDFGCRSTVRTV